MSSVCIASRSCALVLEVNQVGEVMAGDEYDESPRERVLSPGWSDGGVTCR